LEVGGHPISTMIRIEATGSLKGQKKELRKRVNWKYSNVGSGERRPPLWSSGQSYWLQIQGSRVRFPDTTKKKVVGLERGALSLVSTTEELLDRKVAAPVKKTENTAIGIRNADHVAPSIRKSRQSLRRQAAVARSV
jgi:hypothetical protein